MNTKNCECCHAQYATGKLYGDYWCELPKYRHTTFWERCKLLIKKLKWIKSVIVEPKGLCEFCNPNNETWYIHNKECHIDKYK